MSDKRIDQKGYFAQSGANEGDTWSTFEKQVFRIAFIYFVIQSIPLDWKYYKTLFSVSWFNLSYGDIFELARYMPRFFDGPDTFANWLVVLVIAVAGAFIWTRRDSKSTEYNALYYWLRVIVRYRLAVALIAYGFIKLFPLQAPLPSISNLNTAYGDLSSWKLFAMSLGVVPNYQSFLGAVEILGGLLLLYRRTATIGTLIIIPFTGNVFISNLAYEGGEYVYSFYLIILALFLYSFDAIRLYRLLTLEQATVPNRFNPIFQKGWQKNSRVALKTAFVFFFVFFYGAKTYAGYKTGPYQYPQSAGLASAAGLYNVKEFTINGEEHAYSALDPVRWKDVVFENWATISIRSSPPAVIDFTNVENIHDQDRLRNYEQAGSGGRHYYSYTMNEEKQTLHLINKVTPSDSLTLHYSRPDSSTIILSGINAERDSLHVVLAKINKKYLYQEVEKVGRRGEFKL